MKCTLILIRGFPGIGKTTLARNFIDKYDTGFILLDPDHIPAGAKYPYPLFLKVIALLNFVPKIRANVAQRRKYLYLKDVCKEMLLHDKNIIWTQAFTRVRWIRDIRDDLITNEIDCNMLIVELNAPKNIVKVRLDQRMASGGHGASESTFEAMCDRRAPLPIGEFNIVTLGAAHPPEKLCEDLAQHLRTRRLI